MGKFIHRRATTLLRNLLLSFLAMLTLSTTSHAWWNNEWTIRKKLTVDTTPAGAAINEPIGTAVVLVRLYDGNFQFGSSKEDGGDIRFIAADDQTPLKYHIERFDPLLYEAFAWVQVPNVTPGSQTSFWLYYGNGGDKAARADDAKETYDAETVLVYHFAESGSAPVDSSAGGNNAENAGQASSSSLIAGGLRLTGQSAVTIPALPTLAWTDGGAMTWSAWIKPTALQPKGILFSRREEARALVIGVDNGIPFIEVTGAAGVQRTGAGEPLAINAWRHIAVIAVGAGITLFLDGESYATVNTPLPALNSPSLIGKDSVEAPDQTGFTGEMDELQISKASQSAGLLKLHAVNQGGGDKSAKLLAFSPEESAGHGAGGAVLEHVMLFGDIAKNMMFDGWIAVGVCVLMIILGWAVAIQKFNYLNTIQKGGDAFMRQWKHMSTDLTALDHDDEESVKNLGGKMDPKTLRHMHRSPLYHLYHIGSEEIRHRLGGGKDRSQGLSARSIQAIRASLETGLVHENQRMHKGLIFLTISIAGGPYVGLLGTVVGVMITFAIIAKTGEVEVNSIAPGIASALLATVAGLVVAIPALFIYSYLSSRIKDLLAAMQVFIDEFIAKMAEFYPTPSEMAPVRSSPELSPLARQTGHETPTDNRHAS